MKQYINLYVYYRDRVLNVLGWMIYACGYDGDFKDVLGKVRIMALAELEEIQKGTVKDTGLKPNGFFYHRYSNQLLGCFAEFMHVCRQAVFNGVINSEAELEEFLYVIEGKFLELVTENSQAEVKLAKIEQEFDDIEWFLNRENPEFYMQVAAA